MIFVKCGYFLSAVPVTLGLSFAASVYAGQIQVSLENGSDLKVERICTVGNLLDKDYCTVFTEPVKNNVTADVELKPGSNLLFVRLIDEEYNRGSAHGLNITLSPDGVYSLKINSDGSLSQ